jgi:hypothetical protein
MNPAAPPLPPGPAAAAAAAAAAPQSRPDLLVRYANWFNSTFGSAWSNAAGGAMAAGMAMTQEMVQQMQAAMQGMQKMMQEQMRQMQLQMQQMQQMMAAQMQQMQQTMAASMAGLADAAKPAPGAMDRLMDNWLKPFWEGIKNSPADLVRSLWQTSTPALVMNFYDDVKQNGIIAATNNVGKKIGDTVLGMFRMSPLYQATYGTYLRGKALFTDDPAAAAECQAMQRELGSATGQLAITAGIMKAAPVALRGVSATIDYLNPTYTPRVLLPEPFPNAAPASQAARNAAQFEALAQRRVQLGLPAAGAAEDAATLARLEINGQTFNGINRGLQNPPTQMTLQRVNAQTITHAEGDVVQQAVDAGMRGTARRAEMWVDRDPCGACGPSSGLRSLARNLGVDELVVHSPSGTQPFTPTR